MTRKTAAQATSACILVLGLSTSVSAQMSGSPAVEFQGLYHVHEADIRERCVIAEGTTYSQADLFHMEQCLRQTGLFAHVGLERSSDAVIVHVSEMESRPGKLEFSLSYNTSENIVGSFYAERFNIINGFSAQTEFSYSSQKLTFGSNIYRRSLIGDNIGFGIRTHFEEKRLDDQLFNSRRGQIEAYLAHDVMDQLQLEFGIGLRRLEVRDMQADASVFIQPDLGSKQNPFVHFGLQYQLPPSDLVDRFTTRVDGYVWNIGGDRLNELNVSLRSRFLLGTSPYSVLLNADAGALFSQGSQSTRIVDRFSLHPAQLRGFKTRGIGPRDGNQFLGGNRYAAARIEIQREFAGMFPVPVQAGIFANIGSVWGLDQSIVEGVEIDSRARLRATAGVSLGLDVGAVPISLYVAAPIRRVDGDLPQRFGLSIATQF